MILEIPPLFLNKRRSRRQCANVDHLCQVSISSHAKLCFLTVGLQTIHILVSTTLLMLNNHGLELGDCWSGRGRMGRYCSKTVSSNAVYSRRWPTAAVEITPDRLDPESSPSWIIEINLLQKHRVEKGRRQGKRWVGFLRRRCPPGSNRRAGSSPKLRSLRGATALGCRRHSGEATRSNWDRDFADNIGTRFRTALR